MITDSRQREPSGNPSVLRTKTVASSSYLKLLLRFRNREDIAGILDMIWTDTEMLPLFSVDSMLDIGFANLLLPNATEGHALLPLPRSAKKYL